MDYNHSKVEKKWQDIWDEKGSFYATETTEKKKFYALVEFPYPSGQGLHVGHPRPYTALDIVARKRRLDGYNVLYPMGWDAFGLPTENYAIKNKIHPAVVTKENIARFKDQLKSLGMSFDWSREINTTDPNYYRWTQWIFIQLFNKGLAYKKEFPINWCPSCKVGLANEEVVGGGCERCGSQVEQKVKNQWMLKITEYAERLINDLDLVNYIERVKIQQKNWIGRSEGAEVDFKIKGAEDVFRVFTTRPDTLYGATYMVMSPEHPYIEKYADQIENMDALLQYRTDSSKKSEFERTELVKIKTGVEVKGIMAVNPVTNKEIPVWISDYVMMSYGTGAIMAVPGHDTRDWEFAKKFDLPIIEVVSGGNVDEEAYTDNADGVLVNSEMIDGLKVPEAKAKITDFLIANKIGEKKVNYKLRDWVFSRQRYWGEPIPLVHCDCCGWVPVEEKDLPLKLPEVDNYEPTDNGESPLAHLEDWVKTECPKCGKEARRETDTMPQWAGSSWYFLRYCDPHNNEELASKEMLEYWGPVDWYNGGMEHTTLHLLYSRFWHKFLFDCGVVPTEEPYDKRTSHGMILGDNNEKMSKSRGNVINPDDIITEYGADTLRTYEMFIGDFEKSAPWSMLSLKGCKRFLDRVWRLTDVVEEGTEYSKALLKPIHKAIKKVTNDYENMKFNTAIAAMMTLQNEITKVGKLNKADFKALIILLNPVAPHMTEELWEVLGFEGMLNETSWPTFEEKYLVDDEVEIVLQINGKVRDKLVVSATSTKEEMEAIAMASERVQTLIDGKQIVKVICVPKRLVNIVVK